MDPIQINVKLTTKEVVQLNFEIRYRIPFVIFITLLGLIGAVKSLDALFIHAIPNNDWTPVGLGFSFITVVIMPVSAYIISIRASKNDPFWSENLVYTITEDQIAVQGESFQSSVKLPDIKTIKESKRWFIIMYEGKQGYFIPKNRFANENDLARFRQLMSTVKVQPFLYRFLPAGQSNDVIAKVIGIFIMLLSTLFMVFITVVYGALISGDPENASDFGVWLTPIVLVILAFFVFRVGWRLVRRKS